jgi:hypothetical protein
MLLRPPLPEGFASSRGHHRCENFAAERSFESQCTNDCALTVSTLIVCCRYSGLGAYSLAPSLAARPPSLLSSSSNSSSGWSGLYSSLLLLPFPAQIQLNLTVGGNQDLAPQASAPLFQCIVNMRCHACRRVALFALGFQTRCFLKPPSPVVQGKSAL